MPLGAGHTCTNCEICIASVVPEHRRISNDDFPISHDAYICDALNGHGSRSERLNLASLVLNHLDFSLFPFEHNRQRGLRWHSNAKGFFPHGHHLNHCPIDRHPVRSLANLARHIRRTAFARPTIALAGKHMAWSLRVSDAGELHIFIEADIQAIASWFRP